VDLFCGPGGLSRGLQEAGFRVVAAAELEPLAADSYRDNFPGTMLWRGDLRALGTSRARRELARLGVRRGQLHLLAGCPPCEGFSRIRTHNGGREVVDDRNDLVRDFARMVQALLPHFVMLENVPALADDQRFKDLLRLLERLGYEHNGGQIKDVSSYGVPQRRRRLVLVAARRRVARLPDAPPADSARRSVRDAIGGLPAPRPDTPEDPLHDYTERRSGLVRRRISSVPVDGGSRSSLPPELSLLCHDSSDGFKDVYGRMWWDRPAPTITGGCVNPSKGRFLHPDQDRAITLREAARLQSFPDEHVFRLDGGKYRAAEMIGNALPPAFVERHARPLADALRRERESRTGA
jgi:DNA (cytosine-5)-methyltransferase 1